MTNNEAKAKLTDEEWKLLTYMQVKTSDRKICHAMGLSLSQTMMLGESVRRKLGLQCGADLRGVLS